MHPLIPAFLGNAALEVNNTRELMRTKPVERATSKRHRQLFSAFADRSEKLAGGKPINETTVQTNVPLDTPLELLKKLTPETLDTIAPEFATIKYAGNAQKYGPVADGQSPFLHGERLPSTVMINPNADEAFFAHELGHSASTNTKIGDAIRRARDFSTSNPALATSIAMAGGLTPMIAAGLTPGDDDLDEAVLGSLALHAPTLIDEALATKNALAIMEQSGQRANLAQRGRLAGGYLSYLAAPIMTATLGNFIGNQFDEDV